MKRTGPPSFGFVRENGMLHAHPDEAPVRRRIFELFAEHQRKKTVAMILNAEGHRTRSGALFNGTTVGRLLAEETAKGIPGVAETLVPEDLWQRCNDILDKQKGNGAAPRKVAHLFAGLTNCRCGTKMYVPSNTDKYVCTSCRHKIPTDDLEAVFLHVLTQWIDQTDGLDLPNATRFWNAASFDTRRQLIEQIAEHIVVDGKKITFGLVAL